MTDDLLQKALEQIQDYYEEAKQRQLPEPSGITLATANSNGQPSVRTVYLTKVHDEGIVLFINMNSGKGRQIQENPKVGLCLFWPQLQQQITLEGGVEVLDDAISDEYWNHRSRDSQLASWASDQKPQSNGPLSIEEEKQRIRSEFDYEKIPRPEHWKALLVRPSRIEFWETGWHRLRQRMLYLFREDQGWTQEIENP